MSLREVQGSNLGDVKSSLISHALQMRRALAGAGTAMSTTGTETRVLKLPAP
eukprot:gene4938-34709_t